MGDFAPGPGGTWVYDQHAATPDPTPAREPASSMWSPTLHHPLPAYATPSAPPPPADVHFGYGDLTPPASATAPRLDELVDLIGSDVMVLRMTVERMERRYAELLAVRRQETRP